VGRIVAVMVVSFLAQAAGLRVALSRSPLDCTSVPVPSPSLCDPKKAQCGPSRVLVSYFTDNKGLMTAARCCPDKLSRDIRRRCGAPAAGTALPGRSAIDPGITTGGRIRPGGALWADIGRLRRARARPRAPSGKPVVLSRSASRTREIILAREVVIRSVQAAIE
jgi:hypothetical protein